MGVIKIMTTLFAAFHHLAVLVLLGGTLMSLWQLRKPFDISSARLLQKSDMINGIAATFVLLVGLVRVFYLEKGAAYYFSNGPFIAKLALYGLASVLSLVPTLEVFRWREPLKQGLLPEVSAQKLTRMCTVCYLQLACIFAMAFCANLAARGVG
jgi:putative membrane protein